MVMIPGTTDVPAVTVSEEALGITEGVSVEPDDSATPSAGADAESTVDATVLTG